MQRKSDDLRHGRAYPFRSLPAPRDIALTILSLSMSCKPELPPCRMTSKDFDSMKKSFLPSMVMKIDKTLLNTVRKLKKYRHKHTMGPPSQLLMAAGRSSEVTGGLPTGEMLCVFQLQGERAP